MTQRILIVDDSKTTRSMVAFTLRRIGFEVAEAEDGAQALSAVAQSRIDCLISDVNMPNMDGFALVRRLREREEFRALPIIMLTTTVDMCDEQKVRDSGATMWLGKPFMPNELIEAVRGIL